jgi:hypothetical protein
MSATSHPGRDAGETLNRDHQQELRSELLRQCLQRRRSGFSVKQSWLRITIWGMGRGTLLVILELSGSTFAHG